MHPYEVAQTLRFRAKHESIRLNYGSLYNVVDQLVADGFIEVRETVREGRRPERTIYGITEAGIGELTDWLSDLMSSPQKEYLQFEAALSLMPSLPPEDAAGLLEQRVEALDVGIARSRAGRKVFSEDIGLPRLFAIEDEYNEALMRAEREFVADLAAEIRKETLDGIEFWKDWHEGPVPGPPGRIENLRIGSTDEQRPTPRSDP